MSQHLLANHSSYQWLPRHRAQTSLRPRQVPTVAEEEEKMPLLLRCYPKKLLWGPPIPTVNNKSPTRPVPGQLTEKPWPAIPSTLCARAVNQWQVPRRESAPCSLSNCVCTELLRGMETKVGDENNGAEGKQPAPLPGGEQTENQVGRYGWCCVAGRENEKTQSQFFDKTFFGLVLLGPFLLLLRNFSRLFALSFKL